MNLGARQPKQGRRSAHDRGRRGDLEVTVDEDADTLVVAWDARRYDRTGWILVDVHVRPLGADDLVRVEVRHAHQVRPPRRATRDGHWWLQVQG
jgi:hypothetical protein